MRKKTILTYYHTHTHVATAKIREDKSNAYDDTNYLHAISSIYKIKNFSEDSLSQTFIIKSIDLSDLPTEEKEGNPASDKKSRMAEKY